MKLTLSLESDEVIDVPEEAIIEEIDPGKEVVEGFKKLDSFFEIIANLKHVQNNIKRFGVTKELIHLINKDRNFSDSTGITLPYYESDDEADDINEDDIPAEEVVMEGFGDAMKKAKDAVVKFFKWIWEKLKAFGTAIADFFRNYKKKITGAKEKLKKGVDTDKIKEKKAKVMSFKEMEDRLKALNSAVNAVKMWQAGDDMDADTLNAALKYSGKKIEGSVGSYKLGTVDKPEVKEDTLLALGLSLIHI